MKLKRVIALLLCVVMLCSLTVNVLADSGVELVASNPVVCNECGAEVGHNEECSLYAAGAEMTLPEDTVAEETEPVAEPLLDDSLEVGQKVWIKSKSIIYKNKGDVEGHTTDLPHYIKITAVESVGETVWYMFEFTGLSSGMAWILGDYKWVKADDTSVEEPTDPTDPSEPTDPSDPSDPSEPSDPEEPECLCGAEGTEHKRGCPLYEEEIQPIPDFPACDCGGGNVAGHTTDCAYAVFVNEEYLSCVSERHLYAHWSSFDGETKATLTAFMEEYHTYKLYILTQMLDGKLNERATIVDGLTVVAIGPIPEGVEMSASTIEAGGILDLVTDACFAYDISFADESGNDWQPADGDVISITIESDNMNVENGELVEIFHLSDDGTLESIGEFMVGGGELTFEAESFSGYAGVATGVQAYGSTVSDVENIKINLFDWGAEILKGENGEVAVGMGGATSGYLDYTDNTVDDSKDVTTTLQLDKDVNDKDENGVYDGISKGSFGLWPVLTEDGYPAKQRKGSSAKNPTTISLKYLFNEDLAATTTAPYDSSNLTTYTADGVTSYSTNFATHRYPVLTGSLFRKDNDGYFYFNSRNTHAYYNYTTRGIELTDSYAINPDFNGRRYGTMGHFLPFNGEISDYLQSRYYVIKGTGVTNDNNGNGINDDWEPNAEAQPHKVDSRNYPTTTASTLYHFPAYNKSVLSDPKYMLNMWIGMSMELEFNQTKDGKKNGKDVLFEFSGDDSMWLYINNVLVLDISNAGERTYGYAELGVTSTTSDAGGAKTGTINFANGQVIAYRIDSSWLDISWIDANNDGFISEEEKVASNEGGSRFEGIIYSYDYHVAYDTTLKKMFTAAYESGYIEADDLPNFDGETFADYETLTMKMFYMDTGHGTSNLNLRFNIDPLPTAALTVQKEEAELNAAFVGENEYAFELYSKNDSGTFERITNASFNMSGGTVSAKNIGNNNQSTTLPGAYVLDSNGQFWLKDGQTASFMSGVSVHDTIYIKEVSTGNFVASWTTNGVDSTNTDNTRTNDFFIEDLRTYSVICTNTWNSADITITKDAIGKVHEGATYDVLLKIADHQFPLTFNGEGTQTITDIPIGYSYSVSEADPSVGTYKYQNPLFSIDGATAVEKAFISRTVANSFVTWGEITDANSVTGTVKQGENKVLITNRCKVDLKITKTGSQEIDENQTFIVYVYRNGSLFTTVTIKGNSSVVLKDLPVDTYTVTEDENWSWRYILERYVPGGFDDTVETLLASTASGNSVNLSTGNQQILVVNDRTEEKWLSGDSSARNLFNVEDPNAGGANSLALPAKKEDEDENT